VRHGILAIGLVFGIAACAQGGGMTAPSTPIIDTQGVDAAQYQQDLAQCQEYAQQVSVGQDTAKSTIGGALLGAAMGAAIGAATGNAGQGAAVGAAAGGIGGGAGGAGKAMQEKKQIVSRCMQGRGYNVLSAG
jgi:outer membrane lipoprotein SlyB